MTVTALQLATGKRVKIDTDGAGWRDTLPADLSNPVFVTGPDGELWLVPESVSKKNRVTKA